MNNSLFLLSLDLGAESGRVMSGKFNGNRLTLEEVHRFNSAPVSVHEGLFTDVLRIWAGIITGISLAASKNNGRISGIGVDTWGVDFALLDKKGTILSNPHHYRDRLTEGILPTAFRRVSRWEIFNRTGVQCMAINTLYQLYALSRRRSPLLDAARRLLMMPDLFNYWLSGIQANEFCIATTSQCYDPKRKAWAKSLLGKFGLPTRLFGNIIEPGTVVGEMMPKVAAETGIKDRVPVIAPGCHDTALAIAAVPAKKRFFAYISCGTWSLMGAEIAEPCINEKSFTDDFTNEGGVCGTFRFQKNLTGLWIVQECRRAWEREGRSLDYAQLTREASSSPSLRSIIDPQYPAFGQPGEMPEKIRAYCRKTGQPLPESRGAIVRCAIESLALCYRKTLEQLERNLGYRLDPIHLVGGGANNKLLCQCAADATGRPVLAGPVEATAIGNMLMQAMALGQVRNLEQARSIARRSFVVTPFEPHRTATWEVAYARFLNLP